MATPESPPSIHKPLDTQKPWVLTAWEAQDSTNPYEENVPQSHCPPTSSMGARGTAPSPAQVTSWPGRAAPFLQLWGEGRTFLCPVSLGKSNGLFLHLPHRGPLDPHGTKGSAQGSSWVPAAWGVLLQHPPLCVPSSPEASERSGFNHCFLIKPVSKQERSPRGCPGFRAFPGLACHLVMAGAGRGKGATQSLQLAGNARSPKCLCSQAAPHLTAGTNSPGSCFCVAQNDWSWLLNALSKADICMPRTRGG